jgi:uncharacterized protein
MVDRAQAAVGVTLNDIQKRLPPWAKRTILAGMCGSHVHGTWIPPEDPSGTDDVDVFSVIVHPRVHYLGLPYFRHESQSYQTHGEGLDIAVFEAVHYIDLLAKGNPNVNLYLWLQPHEYFARSPGGEILIASREAFLSEKMFAAFGGYAYAQLKRMTHGERMGYMGEKRKALFNQHGYDTKNAAHCIRLFYTGIRLVDTGQLTPKLEGQELDAVLCIKRGENSLRDVETLANGLDVRFRESVVNARAAHRFPSQADPVVIDRLCRDVLETQWTEWRQS